MQKPSLPKQKKELDFLSLTDVKQICIRLSKYKTENKELLDYLLFFSHHPQSYVAEIKEEMLLVFEELNPTDYQRTKQLRKLLNRINKYAKFMANKNYEAELICEFCQLFIQFVPLNTYHKALILLLYKQLIKLYKVISKLDDDLQFDYEKEIQQILVAVKKSRNSHLFIF